MAKNTNNPFADVDIRKLKQHVTPLGVSTLTFLNKPSYEFDEKGCYSVKMKFDMSEPATKKLIKLIDDAREDAFKIALDNCETPKQKKDLKKADPSYKMEEDDDGNETGFVLVNFKRRAKTTRTDKNGNKTERDIRIPMFSAALTPINADETELWGGSKLIISFKLVPFSQTIGVGISHRLEGVQVIEAASGNGQKSADDLGFTKQEVDLPEAEEQEDSHDSADMGETQSADY